MISLYELEPRLTPGWVTPAPMPCDFVAGLYWVPDGGATAAVVLYTTRTDLVPEVQKDLAPFADLLLVVADPHSARPQPHVADVVFDKPLPPQYAGFSGEWGGTPAEVVDNQSAEFTGVIVAHEVGHELSLQHTDEPDNVMYGNGPVVAGWDGWQVVTGRQFLMVLPWNGIA